MNKDIVIATHGELAKGFVSALKIIIGDVSNIQTICGYTTEDFDLNETISKLMKKYDFENNELIVCTDLMGGSINNGFVEYLDKYPFHLVTNINLAFLIDLILSSQNLDPIKLNMKASESVFCVKYVNDVVKDIENDDDI